MVRFNAHPELEGKHAMFGASQYAWLRYDNEKVVDTFTTRMAATKGTELHMIADLLIKNGIRQARTPKTFNLYVNDAIGFRMSTEIVLFYSENIFGTVDALSFRREKGVWQLRIHDLKTGVSKASFDQLMIYAAMFCHEYGFKPVDIEIELRIYQNDDFEVYIPEIHEIINIMDRMVVVDSLVNEAKMRMFD